jgi:Ser/Thr protein kinase RdoA (MazF antagonist)
VSKTEYLALTRRAQMHHIRALVPVALADYDIEARRVRLVAHEYNTTFRVDTVDGRRFALRVNVNSVKEQAHLDAELAWLTSLRDETDIPVPAPVPTRLGAFRTSARCGILERELPIVLMTWLPGRNLDEERVDAYRALGRVVARLHEHASAWTPPTGGAFPSHGDVLLGLPNLLGGDHPALDDAGRAVLAEAHRVAQRAYDELMAAGPVHAIHADLHGDNVKWFRRRIAVFDFDDAADGVPAQDLGVAAYYLRSKPSLESALLEGYAQVREPPAATAAHVEAVLAGRNLVLVNDVIGGLGAADRDFAEPYVRNTVVKLRAFLDSGVYRHDVPGLLPISF